MSNSGFREFASESELISTFKSYMADPKNVDQMTNYLYNSLIDECILSVVFEVHQGEKTGVWSAINGVSEDSKPFSLEGFGQTNPKKGLDCCTCPNCDRLVAAARFAPHLEKCMGMGRNSSRIASRRNREGASYFNASISDDEDDADWSGEKRKKKLQPMRTNGSKKNGKST